MLAVGIGIALCSHCKKAGTHGRETDELGCPTSPAVRPRFASWTQRQHNAALRCLHNKTIWLLGNSIMRGFAFQFQKMLRRDAPWEAQTAAEMSAAHAQDTAESKERCGSASDFISTWNVTSPPADRGSYTTKEPGGFHPNLSVRRRDCWGVCECHFDVTKQLGSAARFVFGWHFEISGGDSLLSLLKNGLNHSGGRLSGPPDILIINAGFPRGVIPGIRMTRALRPAERQVRHGGWGHFSGNRRNDLPSTPGHQA